MVRVKTRQNVSDIGGGMLIATVRDADGNLLGLVQKPEVGAAAAAAAGPSSRPQGPLTRVCW